MNASIDRPQPLAGTAQTVTIIGAGQAAVQLAISLRQEGFGGRILLLNAETWLPYQRPPLSKAFLGENWEPSKVFFRPATFYDTQKIEILDGVAATGIDREKREVIVEGGGRHPYDLLAIATGVEARQLRVAGSHLPHILYLRTLDDAIALRDRIKPGTRAAVVGAGYIGLEIAATVTKLGGQAIVIEAQSRAMSRVASEPLSAFYAAEHEAHGVKLMFNAGVAGIDEQGVRLADETHLPADLIIVGIGVLPADLVARQSGIECDNGILVDAEQRTSDPYVFAVGDCSNVAQPHGGRLRLESVASAIAHGKIAARAMMGLEPPKPEVPWFWSDQFDLKLQIAGLIGRGDSILVRGRPADRKFSVLHMQGPRLTAIECVNNPRDFMAAKKLIAEGVVLDPARAVDAEVPLAQALPA